MKFALFERFGVLPGAGDRHLVEFFPGFLTEESEWGKRWGVALTTIADREARRRRAQGRVRQAAPASTEVPTMPSGEMVAPMIDSFLRDKPRAFPLNLPNAGQCPDLPPTSSSRRCASPTATGSRAATTAHAPAVLAEWLRRIVVVAGDDGRSRDHRDRDKAVDAMLLDPLAGRIDFDHVEQMTDEMLAATVAVAPAVRVTRRRSRSTQLHGRASSTTCRRSRAPRRTTRPTRCAPRSTERGEANVMLATGNSQLVFLAELVHVHRHRLDRGHARSTWTSTSASPPTHSASFQRYMRERVAAQLPFKEFHYLNGDTGDAEAEAAPLRRRCCAPTRSTSCCCGIGENGHLAFNDPPVADFDDPLDVKSSRSSPRRAASRSAKATSRPSTTCRRTRSPSRFPRCSRAEPRARDRARGAQGRPVHDALYGPITTACPASILRRQPHATLYLDAESAAGLEL